MLWYVIYDVISDIIYDVIYDDIWYMWYMIWYDTPYSHWPPQTRAAVCAFHVMQVFPSNETTRDIDRAMNHKTAVRSHKRQREQREAAREKLRHERILYIRLSQTVVPVPLAYRSRLRLKCDGTRAETRFRLSAKQTSPFKSAGASVQSTTGSRGVLISGRNAGYTIFRGSVKGTGYPLHWPVSPSLLLPWVTVCHHVSTGLYLGALLVLIRTTRH
jgi:hypothetical protein